MIKLNAGFSRKIGEANYSSRGASVNLELEIESTAVQDPERMHEKIRALFALARKAVDEELQNGHTDGKGQSIPPKPVKPPPTSDDGRVCSGCGTDRVSRKVVEFSTEKFGRVLCYQCQKKVNGKEASQ